MSSPVFDPTLVLGCTKLEAAALLHGRRVTPGEVETVALTTYQWWRHLRDPRSYWLTVGQAARLLRVSTGTVRTLLDSGRLPYVMHASGVRLMRRHEIEELAGLHRSLPEESPETS
jgi:excisionase family DNA binding protein